MTANLSSPPDIDTRSMSRSTIIEFADGIVGRQIGVVVNLDRRRVLAAVVTTARGFHRVPQWSITGSSLPFSRRLVSWCEAQPTLMRPAPVEDVSVFGETVIADSSGPVGHLSCVRIDHEGFVNSLDVIAADGLVETVRRNAFEWVDGSTILQPSAEFH